MTTHDAIQLAIQHWVAHAREDYVRIAAGLATNVDLLADLRFKMRQCMLTSPLMDAKRFARDIEAAFRGMWQAYCGGAG